MHSGTQTHNQQVWPCKHHQVTSIQRTKTPGDTAQQLVADSFRLNNPQHESAILLQKEWPEDTLIATAVVLALAKLCCAQVRHTLKAMQAASHSKQVPH
jgi:hypothetical protein